MVMTISPTESAVAAFKIPLREGDTSQVMPNTRRAPTLDAPPPSQTAPAPTFPFPRGATGVAKELNDWAAGPLWWIDKIGAWALANGFAGAESTNAASLGAWSTAAGVSEGAERGVAVGANLHFLEREASELEPLFNWQASELTTAADVGVEKGVTGFSSTLGRGIDAVTGMLSVCAAYHTDRVSGDVTLTGTMKEILKSTSQIVVGGTVGGAAASTAGLAAGAAGLTVALPASLAAALGIGVGIGVSYLVGKLFDER